MFVEPHLGQNITSDLVFLLLRLILLFVILFTFGFFAIFCLVGLLTLSFWVVLVFLLVLHL